jgi:hypothetical protein
MLRLQSTKVATSSLDRQGGLFYADDLLVAVIVRLEDPIHGQDYIGKWHLEATFDGLPFPNDRVFDDIEHAKRWIEERIRRH